MTSLSPATQEHEPLSMTGSRWGDIPKKKTISGWEATLATKVNRNSLEAQQNTIPQKIIDGIILKIIENYYYFY